MLLRGRIGDAQAADIVLLVAVAFVFLLGVTLLFLSLYYKLVTQHGVMVVIWTVKGFINLKSCESLLSKKKKYCFEET